MLHEAPYNFFDHWTHVEKSLRGKDILLFLDYDGTLAPIAETPDKAVMAPEMRQALLELSRLSRCHLVVISGRGLSDLKRMIDIPNITYVGNHGFDMEDISNLKSFISSQYEQDLRVIKNALANQLSSIEGVWMEDKGTAVCVHFRMAAEESELSVKRIFADVCQSYVTAQSISVLEGKKVLEVRPAVQWNKGEAAAWILSKWRKQMEKNQLSAIYVGDDVTDEDAFRSLCDVAVTIRVGDSENSFARYFLSSQKDVLTLLEYMKAVMIFSRHS